MQSYNSTSKSIKNFVWIFPGVDHKARHVDLRKLNESPKFLLQFSQILLTFPITNIPIVTQPQHTPHLKMFSTSRVKIPHSGRNLKICKAIKNEENHLRGLRSSLDFFLTSLWFPPHLEDFLGELEGNGFSSYFYIFRLHPSIRWNEIKEIFPFVGRVKAMILRLKAKPIWGDGKL